MGLSGIFVSIVGAGDADLAKHEFLFTLTFDLILLLLLSDIIGQSLMSHREPVVREKTPAPAVPADAAGQEVAL
ncbi:hypothetical protein D3C76_1804900 [compost metagenome]